ncbi:hypothetical protein GII30_11000 [Gordonia amarae]|uniref:Uncharacterized protein n=2 Tax=Gordonia amarae TaxID=36821 RepID=G7GLA7_9ACTN|nr:hypothetical protein [Gordonia amarae]MCS3878908.1 hypothetical protein [Gordonia amarae]QHN17467.1 hypothetical protein GII35_11210 [Gordonia amarae]QHN21993.1 hypothetical protein GII34_10990 [Gordonia amarae]QHN30873.1 hypothetical protein GII32_11165 [Gordonia amarae]QHN39619.1 hypothetical protein GII30_11000 [Gordonia amarae]
MPAQTRSILVRTAAIAAGAGVAALLTVAAPASADVPPGTYTSTTLSGGTVLLQRNGYVQGHDLVLIGRYPIHPRRGGGYYVDFFPGHRVFMNSDGHGGYRGPAFLGGVQVGTFTLTPRG